MIIEGLLMILTGIAFGWAFSKFWEKREKVRIVNNAVPKIMAQELDFRLDGKIHDFKGQIAKALQEDFNKVPKPGEKKKS